MLNTQEEKYPTVQECMLHGFCWIHVLETPPEPQQGKPGSATDRAALEAGEWFCSEEWSSPSSHLGSDVSCVPAVQTQVRLPLLQRTHTQAAWGRNAALLGQVGRRNISPANEGIRHESRAQAPWQNFPKDWA